MGIFGTVRKLALKILDTPFWQSQIFHLFSPEFLMKKIKTANAPTWNIFDFSDPVLFF